MQVQMETSYADATDRRNGEERSHKTIKIDESVHRCMDVQRDVIAGRKICRVKCGADVVIPNVLQFLDKIEEEDYVWY